MVMGRREVRLVRCLEQSIIIMNGSDSVWGDGISIYQAGVAMVTAMLMVWPIWAYGPGRGRQDIGLEPEYRYSDVVSDGNSLQLLIVVL